MITVIVLAAGRSRRMGSKNKLLLPFQGKTMLETTLDQLRELRDAEIVVVLGHQADQVRSLLEHGAVKAVVNPNYASGMTSSIQTGVAAASEQSEGFMICLSDMPLIQTLAYQRIVDIFLEKKQTELRVIVQPVFHHKPGNPVVFSAFYKNDLLALVFPEGCKPIVQTNREFVFQLELETDAILRDADTEEAFEEIKTEK